MDIYELMLFMFLFWLINNITFLLGRSGAKIDVELETDTIKKGSFTKRKVENVKPEIVTEEMEYDLEEGAKSEYYSRF